MRTPLSEDATTAPPPTRLTNQAVLATHQFENRTLVTDVAHDFGTLTAVRSKWYRR
jgi:hypothetical protein